MAKICFQFISDIVFILIFLRMGVAGVPRGAGILPPVPPPLPPLPVSATLPPTRGGRNNRQTLMASVSPAAYGQRLAPRQNCGSFKWHCLTIVLIIGLSFLHKF